MSANVIPFPGRQSVEPTAQGPQLVIPGGERSARQAAASREAEGRGRIRPRKPQQPPAGLFAPVDEPQPDLFSRSERSK